MTAADPISPPASWYAATAVPAPERTRLTFDLDVDVCVIGGGLAGLTTAREVARRGWSVAVLEAERVAAGASGRNCGFVLPGFSEHIDPIIKRVGLERAKALWALSEQGVDYVRATIRDTRMPGVDPVEGWLYVNKHLNAQSLEAEAMKLRDEFGAQVEVWPADKVRGVLKSALYHNAAHFPRAFSIHPLNYARGLAAAAQKAGARIFEHTPALSIDPAGIRKRVMTPSARVRAAHIVLASNTGLGGLMPRLAATLLPVTTYVAVTAPLGARLAEAVAYRGAVTDTERADNHYRVVGGDRLLWSGGMTMWVSDPRRFASRLAADIRRTFPQLGEVAIDHVWSGTLGNAVHRMPQIGEISRGVWIASAFGGHGFNTTAMAGGLIARGIVEGDQTWRLFSPYDLVWAGGTLGRAAVQAGYWATRVAEVVKERSVKHGAGAKSPVTAAGEALPAEMPPAIPAAVEPLGAPLLTIPNGSAAPLQADAGLEKQKRGKRLRAGKAPPRRKAAAAKKQKKPPAAVTGKTETGVAAGGQAPPEEPQPRVKQPAE
jgi:glycine/D-amino acid oxidase-like deaminating enzyme